MIKKWRGIFVLLYIAALMGGFLYYAQRPLSGGAIIVLRVEPFDPRDLLLGNYVRLQYPQLRVSHPSEMPSENRVFALLDVSGNTVESVTLVNEKPESGIFLAGKYTERGEVEFGIERFYAPRATAEGLEKALVERKDVVAVVSVGKDGTGRLVNVTAPVSSPLSPQ